MFEIFSNFFGGVKKFFTQTIPDTISGVINKGKEIVSGVVDTGKKVVTTLHDDVTNYAKGVKEVAQGVTNSAENIVKHGEDTVGDLGKSFAWPLTIGAVALGGILLVKK